MLSFSQMVQNTFITVVTCAGYETGTQPSFEDVVTESLLKAFRIS